MFGNDAPAQTDDQQAATDGSAPAEPTMSQPFNMVSPTTDPAAAPTEPASAPVADETAPAQADDSAAAPVDTSLPPVEEPAPAEQPSPDDLTSIKQQALQQLSPLVGHLEQTPEEKFRTTMMMIQAADNQTLIKTAFEAAQQINDEKERAQALLDVINEINYFTQQKDKDS